VVGFFKSFIVSIVVSLLFALAGLSVFVGDFPPKVSQLKKVYGEFHRLVNINSEIMKNQNQYRDDAELVDAMEKGRQNQLRKFAKSRGSENINPAVDPQGYYDQIDQLSDEDYRRPSSNRLTVQPAPPAAAEIPVELKNQIYNLRAEIFRLSQRVTELEKQKRSIRRQ
jgi:hypothetical protein